MSRNLAFGASNKGRTVEAYRKDEWNASSDGLGAIKVDF